jgi:hypothetical protein
LEGSFHSQLLGDSDLQQKGENLGGKSWESYPDFQQMGSTSRSDSCRPLNKTISVKRCQLIPTDHLLGDLALDTEGICGTLDNKFQQLEESNESTHLAADILDAIVESLSNKNAPIM